MLVLIESTLRREVSRELCLRFLSIDVNRGCEAYVGAHIRIILT